MYLYVVRRYSFARQILYRYIRYQVLICRVLQIFLLFRLVYNTLHEIRIYIYYARCSMLPVRCAFCFAINYYFIYLLQKRHTANLLAHSCITKMTSFHLFFHTKFHFGFSNWTVVRHFSFAFVRTVEYVVCTFHNQLSYRCHCVRTSQYFKDVCMSMYWRIMSRQPMLVYLLMETCTTIYGQKLIAPNMYK